MSNLIITLRQYADTYEKPPIGRQVEGTVELLRKTADILEQLTTTTIYILERDNPEYTPEPEVYTNSETVKSMVRKEYEAQMSELGTTQEKADAGNGLYRCYWNFSEEKNDSVGDALIDGDGGINQWKWRVTTHEIENRGDNHDK